MDLISFGFYNKEDAIIFNRIIENYNSLYITDKYEEIEKVTGNSLEKIRIHFKLYVFSSLICIHKDMFIYDSTEIVQEINEYYFNKINGIKTLKQPIFFNIIDDLSFYNLNDFILIFSEEFNEEVISRIENVKFSNLKDRLFQNYVWNENYYNFTSKSFTTDYHYPLIFEVKKHLF